MVVLDTNILVSGLLHPESSPGVILQRTTERWLPAAYNSAMLQEYQDVLSRPKFSSIAHKSLQLLSIIEKDWQFVITPPLELSLPDPHDAPFLETAIAIRADALITGNLRHFPISARQGIPIVGPAEFLSRLYKAR
jgi:putative PIN family toxin of toxin-antitoxin system